MGLGFRIYVLGLFWAHPEAYPHDLLGATWIPGGLIPPSDFDACATAAL